LADVRDDAPIAGSIIDLPYFVLIAMSRALR
jgi:hypothetical protein